MSNKPILDSFYAIWICNEDSGEPRPFVVALTQDSMQNFVYNKHKFQKCHIQFWCESTLVEEWYSTPEKHLN